MKFYARLTLLFLTTCVFYFGCGDQATWRAEGDDLLLQATRLTQQHNTLNTQIDSLWNTTTTALAAAIPKDFPPTDRQIFLNARNADHIRMFMSFQQLDKETQALVDAAGRYDQILASKFRALQQQRKLFDHQKIDFLSKIADTDSSDFRYYVDRFQVIALSDSK